VSLNLGENMKILFAIVLFAGSIAFAGVAGKYQLKSVSCGTGKSVTLPENRFKFDGIFWTMVTYEKTQDGSMTVTSHSDGKYYLSNDSIKIVQTDGSSVDYSYSFKGNDLILTKESDGKNSICPLLDDETSYFAAVK
jgi:hypothetical protein